MGSFPAIGAQVGFWIYKEYPQEDIYREGWRIYHLCQLSFFFFGATEDIKHPKTDPRNLLETLPDRLKVFLD